MSDVDPQGDRESNFPRRSWRLVTASSARRNRLARYVRSPARAELPHYRRGTQLLQLSHDHIIYKAYGAFLFMEGGFAGRVEQRQGWLCPQPRHHILGLPFSNWTTANLAEYMAEQTSILISPRQVERYLKLGDWRLRRPVRTVKHKQDPDLVAEKKTHR